VEESCLAKGWRSSLVFLLVAEGRLPFAGSMRALSLLLDRRTKSGRAVDVVRTCWLQMQWYVCGDCMGILGGVIAAVCRKIYGCGVW
jgi:hypothetical protein